MRMKQQSEPSAVKFVTGVVRDNWSEHQFPLVASFAIPLFAHVTNSMNVWVICASVMLLVATWMSMVHRDMAECFRGYVLSQEQAMGELLAERFQAALEKKLESAVDGDTINLSIKVDEENNVHVE